ncbi:MAG: D-2-hydroxyacid dehydrogenase [Proteobacteria bacterium]|nr:D-2-hydroxyacid dehydrogenase [Pseudomonadota bacterium]
MKRPAIFAATWLVFLFGTSIAYADISIEDLVRDSGITEGPVAMRDRPNWRGAHKILIWPLDDEIESLRQIMPDTEFVVVRSTTEALNDVADADAIVGLCNEELIAAASDLVWVQIYSAGAERCLAAKAVASGSVILTNAQKMSSPVIGEHAIAMMLALARRLPTFAKMMGAGEWNRGSAVVSAMTPIAGKTLLVVGLGGIGTAAAQRGAALGMRVIATRNSSREGPDYVDYVGLSSELLQLAGEADVIINALPLTDATRGLLDEEFFAATRKGAFFINVGRGGTVDTQALTDALTSGYLGGAGLDVTDPEPLPPNHPLWQLENVIITPHVASRGEEDDRYLALVKENLRRYAAGERLLNVVDPERGY